MSQAKRIEHQHSRASVLIVDDEAAICTSLGNVLRDENFETSVAYDGAEALERIKAEQPDVVFLDMWMPGWDGIETLEKIKQVSPQTEVVMISGHATIANALDAMKRGASDFIEKPFDIESVIVSASRALERKKLSSGERKAMQQQPWTPQVVMRKNAPTSLFSHPGLKSAVLRGRNRRQRTLGDSVILYGQCLHSGMKSGLVLEPLPPDSGLHFAQMGSSKTVPVYVDYVESTSFATTIRSGGTIAATVEHLLAVLHAYGISNLLIKCNGEVPIFDGSGKQFCSVIDSVGIEEQGGDWYEIAVDRPILLSSQSISDRGISDRGTGKAGDEQRETISILPADSFRVTYELEYPAPVGKQIYTFTMNSPEDFRRQIAPARTFGFMRDIERLQKAGLAAGGRLDNFILIGNDGVVNTDLRFKDELPRHKILDIMGDLFLLGRPLCCAIHARMTGHSDNIELLRKLKAYMDEFES